MIPYIKKEQVIFLDRCNRFIYEVFVVLMYDGMLSTIDHKFFSSEKELSEVIPEMALDEYLTVESEMYSAPKKWLESHNFIPYVKKKKIRKTKPKV